MEQEGVRPGDGVVNVMPVGPDGFDAVPAPGELGLKERRSWRTWQLVVGMGIAALVGMAITYESDGGAASGSGKSNSAGAYTPPPPAGSTTTTAPATGGSTTTTSAGGSASGGSSTTTTTSGSASAGSSTTTTSTATGSTTTTVVARVLLGPMQSSGDWTSSAFTITAPSWNIGWAFRCSPAPTAGTSFEVFVTPPGVAPTSAAAISETGASGQAVTAQTGTGQQSLVVQAPATCSWAVKVTGS